METYSEMTAFKEKCEKNKLFKRDCSWFYCLFLLSTSCQIRTILAYKWTLNLKYFTLNTLTSASGWNKYKTMEVEKTPLLLLKVFFTACMTGSLHKNSALCANKNGKGRCIKINQHKQSFNYHSYLPSNVFHILLNRCLVQISFIIIFLLENWAKCQNISPDS